jgi:hypothetical protein
VFFPQSDNQAPHPYKTDKIIVYSFVYSILIFMILDRRSELNGSKNSPNLSSSWMYFDWIIIYCMDILTIQIFFKSRDPKTTTIVWSSNSASDRVK